VPFTVDLPVPASALAVGAHADDVEFGAGATLAKWAGAGAAVHLLVLTDGSKGTWEPGASLPELVATRQREQKDAATVLGVAGVTFFDGVDGELAADTATQAQVCEVIRTVRPAVVLGHDPWQRGRLHPDHRHAGFLVFDAIVAARDPHFFPDQRRAPHRPEHLLLFESDAADHYERVDRTVAAKVEALLRHRSQWETTMQIVADSPAAEAQRAAFARRISEEAAAAGAPAALAYAEAFKRIDHL
jgi:LmbE family N-acetylglucosaminyl deacetylase